MMNLEKNKIVYHIDIYDGNEQMKIIEITDTKVLLEGDYSGGTHNVSGREWHSIEGIIIKGNCESNLY